tara:strand:- start:98 stop:301 length:204 start_codon:yes stop_codon:yes gene_type:complete
MIDFVFVWILSPLFWGFIILLILSIIYLAMHYLFEEGLLDMDGMATVLLCWVVGMAFITIGDYLSNL